MAPVQKTQRALPRPRGDPSKETSIWLEKLAEVDCKRSEYQEAFAADAVTLPELKAYLSQLDESRKTAEHRAADYKESSGARVRA